MRKPSSAKRGAATRVARAKERATAAEGIELFYEGDTPEAFAAEIDARFGFDPSEDPAWGEPVVISYKFHCPPEHVDAIRGRWPMGT